MSPAAPSLVVLGEKESAISVTFRDGSLSRMVTAEERPITPAPTTAMEAMFSFFFRSSVVVTRSVTRCSRYPYPDHTLFNVDDLDWKLAEKYLLFFTHQKLQLIFSLISYLTFKPLSSGVKTF